MATAADRGWARAYDTLACGVVIHDARGVLVYANTAARQDAMDVAWQDLDFEFLATDGAPVTRADLPMTSAARSGRPSHAVVGVRVRGGDTRWWTVDAAPVLDEGGVVREVVSTIFDVTQQRDAERALREQALRDALTQLPNRALLLDRLAQAIAQAARDKTTLALLLMDLDHFKEVNDAFGHQAGDVLLRQIGDRLAGAIRRSDSLGRLGGDEFAFVLPRADEAGALLVARTLLASLEPEFTVEGQAIALGASVGVALYPRHGEDGESLLRRADIAMYSAKRNGGGAQTYAFEDQLDPSAPNRLTVIAELRHALEADEIALLYQPILNLIAGQETRAEALARWRHPTRGLVLPADFIAPAERSGLIRELFASVLRTALRACATWRALGYDLRIAVNLSARNLADPALPEVVARALEESNLTAASLGLEITETVLMADPERMLKTLRVLQQMGLHLAVDDFGVGYSSLAYLQRLPVYAVKIDRSFVNDMRHDSSSRTIVEATVDLAHRLGLKACAEGVEDQETLDMLASIGCDSAQGYHVGRPMPAAKLVEWAERRRDARLVDLGVRRAGRLAPRGDSTTAAEGA